MVRAADCRSAGLAQIRVCPFPSVFDETTDQLKDYASNEPAGRRARGTSMGGLYVAATLQAPLLLVGQRQCLRSGLPLRALRSSTFIDARRHEHQ